MLRFIPLWLVLFVTVFGLGCSEQRETPPTGIARSAGTKAPPYSLTDSKNPTEEGEPFQLIAETMQEPLKGIAFAYACDTGVTDYTKCKGQFEGMRPQGWTQVAKSRWRSTWNVNEALKEGEYVIVAFSDDFGPSTPLPHKVLPRGGGGQPCCEDVKSFAIMDSPSSPSFFGTPVTIDAVFEAKPGATSFTSSYIEFYRNGNLERTETPREKAFGSGIYVASTTFALLPVGQHDVKARLVITLDGSTFDASLPKPHDVEKLETSTTVTGPATSTVGQLVTFTASFTAVPIGGKIDFYDGVAAPSPFDSATVSPNHTTATGSTNKLPAGERSIVARYTPNQPENVKGSQGSMAHTVDKANSQLTLSSGTNPSIVGQSVDFTAAVTCAAGAPTGSISFNFGDGSIVEAPITGGSAVAPHVFATESAGYAVSASWTGDVKCKGSNGSLSQVVNKAGASLVVTGPSTASYGDNVTFTATLSTPGATPTGSVKFSWVSGGTTTPFGTATLEPTPGGAKASASISTLAGQVAPYTITAEYGGDANYASATASTSITINPKATTTTVTTNKPAGTVYGELVNLTATVVRATPGGAGAPTGTVSFYSGSTTGPVLGGGPVALVGTTAVLSIATLSVNNHDIVAVFTPATGQPALNWASSNNSLAPLVQQVRRASTATVTITSNSPSGTGAPVTFTATVTATAPGAEPAGGNTIAGGATVTFKDGATTLGTGTAGASSTWTYTTSDLTAGTHTITAEYGGNASFSPSTSPPITQAVEAGAPSIVLTASKSPSVFGESVTFTAAVTKPTGEATGNVTFKDGATTIGTVPIANGSASLPVSNLSAGVHAIQAAYETATSTLAHSVNTAGTATTLTSSLNPSVFGQSTTLTAKVTSATTAIPTGSVVFKSGGVAIATATLDASGSATTPFTAPSGGTHPVAAEYAGDSNFGASSDALDQVVSRAESALSLAASANPSRLGSNVTFTATVSAVAPATAIPTGEVVFTDDGTEIGRSDVGASGAASLTLSSLGEGAHTIGASFAQTSDFGASSATLPHTVSQNATAISVASSPSPSKFGAVVTITATLGGATTTPTGSVTFKAGASTLATVAVDASGLATTTTNALPFGDTLVVAEYGGDTNNDPGSASTTHVVEKGSTTIAVVSSANPATAGATVAFNATVLAGGASITGEIEFLDGATTLGTVAISGGSATFTTSTLTLGTHPITARYLGSTQLDGSTSDVLSQEIVAAATPDGGAPGGPSTPGPGASSPDAATTPPISVGPQGPTTSDGGGCSTTPRGAPGALGGAAALLAFASLALRRRKR
ncbi:MAG: Ig-like domain repeat protein [Labilithrix sp.]|nr:Ig-like domain repeat protein [Labilithrix sp.]MCW5809799.1 Ig-like domain repeat protein [Labilithrix sp.]